MNRLDGKIALITGGARGQGAAEARLFAQAGAQVVITDVDGDLGQQVAADIGPACSFAHQDVTSEQGWTDTVKNITDTHGRLDILVNNAGIFRVTSLEDTTLEAWNQLVQVNQTSVFLGLRTVAPIMKAQRAGSIINLSSIAGLGGTAMAPAYSATKWAVRGLSRCAALDLAPFNVRVNSVHPGLIDTRMMDEFETTPDALESRVPMGRLGTVDDVARLVLYLASDDSSYSTGGEFTVDGAVKA